VKKRKEKHAMKRKREREKEDGKRGGGEKKRKAAEKKSSFCSFKYSFWEFLPVSIKLYLVYCTISNIFYHACKVPTILQ